MKLAFSQVGDPRGRHLVLTCESGEDMLARQIILSEVLPPNVKPVREKWGTAGGLYRFNLKHLDKLILCFPFCELSDGIRKRLHRAEEKRIEGFEVPQLRIPGFKGKLYDYQAITTALLTDPDYAKRHGYSGVVDLLNHEMGLGKTYIALAAIAILQAYPALLVVPNNAKYPAWADVIDEFYPDLSYVVYDAELQSKEERDALIRERADLTIVNIEAIRATPKHADPNNRRSPIVGWDYDNPALFDFEYEYAVIDEHHRIKTPYAKVTNGFFQLQAGEWWCPMSGTPILNRIEEIWTVLHKLYPEKFPSFAEFIDTYCIKQGDTVVAYKVGPMAELREFLKDRSIRFRKDQVLKDLPEVTTMVRLVKLNSEERRIYNQIEDKMLLEMEDGTIRHIGGALPQITRLKQACFSPELFGGAPHSSKIEELKEIVAELVSSGEKALIFSQWETSSAIIKRELEEYNPAYVTGKVKNKDRGTEIKRFNNDDSCHLYIGTIGANKEAINLGAATYVIFTDEGWVPAEDDQAVGRSAAGGLRGLSVPVGSKVTVIALQAEDTYEQNSVVLMKDRKRSVFDRTIERDGGKGRKVQKITLGDLKASLSSRAQKKVSRKRRTAPLKAARRA